MLLQLLMGAFGRVRGGCWKRLAAVLALPAQSPAGILLPGAGLVFAFVRVPGASTAEIKCWLRLEASPELTFRALSNAGLP